MPSMNWTELRRSLLGDSDPSILPPQIPLPILPHALIEFSRAAENPDCGPKELGRIIETDSGLTCDLLKYVNSARFGIKSKISTAQQAIATLGVRASKLYLLTAGAERAMQSKQSKLINFQAFWLTNLERALAARELALKLKANADVAFAGAMLHDLILPLLANANYEKYVEYMSLPEELRPRLVQFERTQFGWDHALATAQVLLNWSFPDELICCVLMHHRGLEVFLDERLGRTSISAVAIAALIPDSLYQSGHGLEQLVKLDTIWPQFQLQELSESVDQQLHEMSPQAGTHFSLKRRCKSRLAAV